MRSHFVLASTFTHHKNHVYSCLWEGTCTLTKKKILVDDLPLCSPRKTSLNFLNGLLKSAEADIVIPH